MYTHRRYSANGGLLSYEVDITEQGRNAGLYTGRILMGEKPLTFQFFSRPSSSSSSILRRRAPWVSKSRRTCSRSPTR
jgi:ABC-type uncharacterized transport system substrate-binding protein